ncbi:MAG: MMPL family transporter, partial [Methanomassiliicoccales archaeon]|nr:MMPL family transporter [Methanomassiliicoccales archaeon]
TKILRDERRARKGKVNKHYQKKAHGKFSMGRVNTAVGKLTHKAPWAVVGVALIVTAAAGYGAVSLPTTFDLNDFLPESMDVAKDIKFLSMEFNITGGSNAQILVKGDVIDPAAVIATESSISAMADIDGVLLAGENADVSSYLSVMYDFATNSTGPGYVDPNYNATFATMYDAVFERSGTTAHISTLATPEEMNTLIGMLYMSSDSAISMAQVLVPNDDGYTAVMTVNINPNLTDNEIEQLNEDLKVAVQPMKNAGLTAVVTGEIILTQLIMKGLNASQSQSLITTLVASLLIMTAVMWVLRRSYVLGTLATIPVALCVVWMWGTMFIAGIPMNVMTLMIASLTVGMGVTYGIHVTHRFVEEIHEHEDIEIAVDNAVGKTGTSLLGAALTTVVGFGIIGFSILPPIQEFGVITAIAITYSFVASVFVLPAFLVIWAKARAKRKTAEKN